MCSYITVKYDTFLLNIHLAKIIVFLLATKTNS